MTQSSRRGHLALSRIVILALVLARVANAAEIAVSEALAAARRGEYETAIRALEARVKADAADGESRLELGRVLLTVGRRQEAEAHFTALVEEYNRLKPADSASHTWAGAAGAYTGSVQEAIRVLEMGQKADPDNVRAFIESGLLFAAKYQTGDARRDLEEALRVDSNNVDALCGLALVSFQDYKFDELRGLAGRILRLDSRRHEPRLLMARVLMLEEETLAAARAELAAALGTNPRDPETLSLLAALEYLAGAREKFEAVAARALAVNPSCAAAFSETAELLTRSRRHVEAETLFRRAMAVDPVHVRSLDGLGQLMLRQGRETEGRELLEEVARLDPFRVPAVNLLKTLDYMDDEFVYAGKGELLFRLHPWRDSALVDRLPAYAAAAMQSLASAPGFSQGAMVAPTSVLLEVFPEHRWFSARICGLPWNGPVGACFGRMVVLDSPRSVRTMNWRQIIQHELAHAHHLAATAGQTPHWFTEGLATFQEAGERAPEWDKLLARALALDELLPFDKLNRGFLSPRNAGDWTLAYCQAELAIEHLVEKHGPLAPSRLLQAYGRGLRAGDAIRAALGTDPARLASSVAEFWRSEAAAVPVAPVYYPGDLPLLQQRYRRSGAAADGAAVARALMQGGDGDGARRLLRSLLAAGPEDTAALTLAGELMLRQRQYSRAAELLERAVKSGPDDYEALIGLAVACEKLGRDDRAAELAHAAAAKYSRDGEPYAVLATLARKRKDTAAEKRALDELIRSGSADVARRVRRARIALEQKEPGEALSVLEQAAEMDACDAELNRARGEAFEALGKTVEARRAYRDMLSARWLASFDRTPPSSAVQAVAEQARAGSPALAQGAAELLGLLDDRESLSVLDGLASSSDTELKHRAEIARGRRDSGASVPGLIEALGCSSCAPEAAEALAGLSARPGANAGAWWAKNSGGDPARWLEDSLAEAGYPIRGTTGRARLGVLLVALEDGRWTIRSGALAGLKRATGKQFGQGAFGAAGDVEPALARARKEAFGRWKMFVKQMP